MTKLEDLLRPEQREALEKYAKQKFVKQNKKSADSKPNKRTSSNNTGQ